MLSEDIVVYPNNVVALLVDRFKTLSPDFVIVPRRLRPTDANESVGVHAQQWAPDEDSYEVKGFLGASEPTLSRYLIVVEGFVKDTDEERGLVRHAVMAKLLRVMLYRDMTLRIALQTMSVEMFDSVERTGRYGIAGQQYISAEIQGSFLYLSTLEFWVETSTD